MSSVYEEIKRLETAKSDIEKAIETCGVNVPDDKLIDTYASYISQIPLAVFSEFTVGKKGGPNLFIQSIEQENGKIIAETGGLVSASNSGLVPKIGSAAAGTITSSTDEWVLTSNNGSEPTWRKLPTNVFNSTTYTYTVVVGGDSNTYYPVRIDSTSDKTSRNQISVWKNLGSQTASYSGNHSNGTSSLWLQYEGRYTGWDGNGGYYRTWYKSLPYATLVSHAIGAPNGVGDLIVWLRGGGTEYKVSTTYKSEVIVYLQSINLGSDTYPYVVDPRTNIGNAGIIDSIFYGNASSADKWKNKITLTIGSTGKSVDGSGNVSWSLAEIGASTLGHNHDNRYLRWSNALADTNAMTWGTLTAAKGYIILSHANSSDGGDMGWAYKNGQISYLIDGYFYLNEGKNRVTDVTETVTNLSTSENYLTWTKNGITTNITIPYATKANVASYLTNTQKSDPAKAVNDDNKQALQWFSTIASNSGYAGNNYGFPVSNNANGILYLGTHGNSTTNYYFGGQLGVSSNGRLYYRFNNGNAWSTTTNGGSWNKIAWASEIPTALKNPNALTLQPGPFTAKTYDGSSAVTVNIPTYTSHLTNDSGFITSNHTHPYVPHGYLTFTPANSELTSENVLSLTGNWSMKKGTWNYAGNGYIKAGDFGNIDLAGTSILTFGASGAYTLLFITAPTQSGHSGITNEMLFYLNHGSSYSPGWTRVLTNRNYSSYALPFYKLSSGNCNDMSEGLTVVNSVATNQLGSNFSAFLTITNIGTPFQLQIPDSSNAYIYKRCKNSGVWSTTWLKLSAGYADSAGNASSATKLTSSAGSATIPIYFSDGKPVACTPASIFSDLSNDGNNISMTVAGQNRKLTVSYALNADKLDNIDSTGFLRYYNSNAAPSDVNIVNIPSYVWTVSTTGGTITNAKKPAGVDNAWGVIHLHTHPGNYATQLGFGGTTNRMYMRNAYNNNTFGDWKSLAFTSDLDKYVPKNYNNIAYSDLIAYYTGGTKPDYYRIVLPDNVLSIWNMLTIELTINQNYALGYVGKILIYCLNNGSNIFSNFKASCLGTLTNDIKIYGSNGKYIYINGCLSYSTISIDKILVGDSATRQDQSNITIDIVSGLPSSYQTAQMIYNVDSSNIGRLSVNSATKLQTPRTIWGQSFDGSANVSGDMTGVGIINTIFNLKTQSGNASLYLETVTATTDYAHLFVNNKNDDKSNKSRPLVLQNCYGNVGIGIANPTQKLEVNGNIKATSFIGNLNGNATSATSLGSGALKHMCSLYTNNTPLAYKITTNWNKSLQIMPTINIRGYAYGTSMTIDCDIVMYHYNNTAINYSLTNKGSYPIRVWQNIENDVQVFYISPGVYFGMFNVFVYGGMGTNNFTNWTMTTADTYSGTEISSKPIATSITGNADTVDNYHASNLWRSDGATWNPGANVKLLASGNNQEWSFDITRNGYTGTYWHVWDSTLSTMLKVNADDGKVSAPYGFVGNLTGTADASKYLKSNSTSNSSALTYYTASGISETLTSGNGWCKPSGVDSDGNSMIIRVKWSSGNYGHDIYAGPNAEELWHRNTKNTSCVWRKIIDSGNIGSQSVNYATSSGIARALGTDDSMKLYALTDNEINFGGTNGSNTIYFGCRAKDSKPIPTNFVFGGGDGSATLKANGFSKKGSSDSYILLGGGGHKAISNIDVPVGTILMWPSNTLPNNYMLCDGSSLNKNTYATLFAVLGTTYGGSGNNFNLPNLKGKFIVGKDANVTDYNGLAKTGGKNKVKLSLSEIPLHNHDSENSTYKLKRVNTYYSGEHSHNVRWGSYNGNSKGNGYYAGRTGGSSNYPVNVDTDATFNTTWYGEGDINLSSDKKGFITKTNAHIHLFDMYSSGGDGEHENRPPFIVLNYIIKVK